MQVGSENVPQETESFPQGVSSLLNDKAKGKVIVPRKNANKPIFPRERAEGRFPRG